MDIGQNHTFDETPNTEKQGQRQAFHVAVVDEIGPVELEDDSVYRQNQQIRQGHQLKRSLLLPMSYAKKFVIPQELQSIVFALHIEMNDLELIEELVTEFSVTMDGLAILRRWPTRTGPSDTEPCSTLDIRFHCNIHDKRI